MFEYNIIDCKERTSPNENVNYNSKTISYSDFIILGKDVSS